MKTKKILSSILIIVGLIVLLFVPANDWWCMAMNMLGAIIAMIGTHLA